MHPALSAVQTRTAAELTPIAERLLGTPFQVTRFEQRPRGVGSAPSAGAVGFALDDGRPGSLALLRPATAVNALGMLDACFDRETGEPYAQLVAAWVAGDPALFTAFSDEESRAQQAFQAMSLDQTWRWLTSNESAVRGCALTSSDFGAIT